MTKDRPPPTFAPEPTRMAINLGAGMISCDLAELAPAVAASAVEGKFDIRKWGKDGLEHITPLWLLKYLPNMLACHIGIIHDIQGPSNTITCAEASAHLAIAEAAQVVARGASDIALAGAAEAKVSLLLMVRQWLLRRATPAHHATPEQACRPFDAGVTGSVFGEGAGMIVLESLEYARGRGARILAEVAGIGHSHSLGPTYESLEPDGKGIQTAVDKALADAEIRPNDLDLIVPHGTGIPWDDLAEARGLEAALGSAIERIPVWPTKSMLSTTGAASGALDTIAAVRAIVEGIIPAAKNFERPAEGCHLNVLTQRRDAKITHVLCGSYTHGGQTAALVLKAFDEDTTE